MINFKLKLLSILNIIALYISEFLLSLGFIKSADFLINQVKINSNYIEEVINNG